MVWVRSTQDASSSRHIRSKTAEKFHVDTKIEHDLKSLLSKQKIEKGRAEAKLRRLQVSFYG
jgi:hypothetical protein